MRKIVATLIVLMFCLSLCACGSTQEENDRLEQLLEDTEKTQELIDNLEESEEYLNELNKGLENISNATVEKEVNEYAEIESLIEFSILDYDGKLSLELKVDSEYGIINVYINDQQLEQFRGGKTTNGFVLLLTETEIQLNEVFDITLDLGNIDGEIIQKAAISNVYFGNAILNKQTGYAMCISKLSELSHLTDIQHLILKSYYNDKFTGKIDDLYSLENLKSICINGFYDICGDMSQLKSVKYLKLSGYTALDSSLYSMPNLKSLFLKSPYNSFIDYVSFKNIIKLRKLEHLTLVGFENLKDEIGLLNTLALKRLLLVNCELKEVSDIMFLEQIPTLETLEINDVKNLTGNIDSLSTLTNLKSLSLEGKPIADVTGDVSCFNELVNINTLSLSNISSLTGAIEIFENMKEIEVLSINGGELTGDISVFNKLTNLKRLYLYSCDNLNGNVADIDKSNLFYGKIISCENIEGELDTTKN